MDDQKFVPNDDICKDLRGGSKRTYPGGAPPYTPPYLQWGALTQELPTLSLLPTHGDIFGGVPPRYFSFPPSLIM